LLAIGPHTLRTWGEDQTVRYPDDLEAGCHKLAGNPALSRSCDEIRPGLRRMELARHVVFYRECTGGILVSRILHQSMLSERHVIDKESRRQPQFPSRECE